LLLLRNLLLLLLLRNLLLLLLLRNLLLLLLLRNLLLLLQLLHLPNQCLQLLVGLGQFCVHLLRGQSVRKVSCQQSERESRASEGSTSIDRARASV